MNEWLDRQADALDEPRITDAELGEILKLAREVAHRVERRFAPLSTFLAGVAVGMRTAAGSSRDDAFRDVVAATRALLPAPGPPDG